MKSLKSFFSVGSLVKKELMGYSATLDSQIIKFLKINKLPNTKS